MKSQTLNEFDELSMAKRIVIEVVCQTIIYFEVFQMKRVGLSWEVALTGD